MTPEELSQRIFKAAERLVEIDAIASKAALDESITEGEGSILERIFNKNQDITGTSFGSYSEEYADFRRDLGLDASKKNLQFSENMKNTIYVDYDSNELKLSDQTDSGITSPRKAAIQNIVKNRKNQIPQWQKARFQEQQMGKKIFEASDKEAELVNRVYGEVFIDEFLKLIRA